MSSASRSSRTSARSTAAPGRPSPLTVGNVDQCPYCQAAHTAGGKAAGLTGDEMISVRRGNVETDPKLDALLAVAREVTCYVGAVPDTTRERSAPRRTGTAAAGGRSGSAVATLSPTGQSLSSGRSRGVPSRDRTPTEGTKSWSPETFPWS